MATSYYRNSLRNFLDDVESDRIVNILFASAADKQRQPPDQSEIKSWRASLPALAKVLNLDQFLAAEIFVELFMPSCSKRCDALLTGLDSTRRPSAVVVELKQWTVANKAPYPEHVTVGNDVRLHPAVQVRGYVEQLRHYNSAFTDPTASPILIGGCSFLHDFSDRRGLTLLRSDPFHLSVADFPIFARDDTAIMQAWLALRLSGGPGQAVAEAIAKGRIRPSEKLIEILQEVVKGEREFQLMDEQRTAFFKITSAVQVAKDSGTRTAVIVRGGPGTGKSVLAVQLLAYGASQGWGVAHATGSKAFSMVLKGRTMAFARKKLLEIWNAKRKGDVPVDDLFTTFADVARLGSRDDGRLDLLVCDEAHRLWKHRRMVYPNGKVQWLSETDMVEEVLRSAKVSAFFIDDDQAVRAGEIGRSSLIREAAERLGYRVEWQDLDAQFRCAGSESWIAWVDAVLGFRSNLDLNWRRDQEYDLVPFGDPAEMEAWLLASMKGGERCRMVAGFCWKWSKPSPLGALPHDIRIGDWSAPWIEKTGKDLKPLDNQYYKWATDDEKSNQVGSIYSVQGFEFDRVGVIWGNDLVWRTDRWVAQPSASKDGAFKKELSASGEDPAEKLRNVYRVLLTRGMRATGLHIVDPETRAHVTSQILGKNAVTLVA